jgi:RNA polymerase sigma-70 factor (ECF subfamily)
VEDHGHAYDLQLARAAAEGRPAARRELAERMLDRVSTVVRCLGAGNRNRDDYVQDAMIEVLKSIGSFRGQSSLETWAERVTVRVVLRRIRKQSYRDGVVALDSTREGRSSSLSSEEQVMRRRFWERVEAVLAALGPERRVALTLQLVLGYSVAEIAEATGAPVNTVRDRLAVGRKLLRAQMLADPELVELVRDKGSW